MAVPAHDERDFAFAKKYNLPINKVLDGDISESAFTGDAPHINSGVADGLNIKDAKEAILNKLIKEGNGERQTNYKLRDWLLNCVNGFLLDKDIGVNQSQLLSRIIMN